VEALVVGYNFSEEQGHTSEGCSHTSDFEGTKVGMTRVVEVPVILRDHRDKWEASLNGEMEGTLLERPYIMVRT
jgi:hypothetical protein